MKNIHLLIMVLLFCAGSFAQSKPAVVAESTQATNEKFDALKLMLEIESAEMSLRLCSLDSANAACKENPAQKVTDLYAKAVQSPDTSKLIIAKLIKDYQQLRESAQSAPQVSQVANESGIKMQMLLITQNQKIIDLLEQLVKKK